MQATFVNYNFTPDWIKDYDFDYLIYDRSDSDKYLKNFTQDRIIKTENIGNVDYDRLGYLVDNYDSLPDVFLWSKSNLFKYITKEEFDQVKDNKFTPLLTQHHKAYSNEQGIVCYYKDKMFHEINNNWYLNVFHGKHVTSFKEWAKIFGLPNPDYIPFAPGGNYILTKETVHKHPKRIYAKMRDMLPYTKLPGEAQLAERSYYLLWS